MSSWWKTICGGAWPGESAAERYEIELMGRQGQVTRVELSSTVIDSAGEAALLLTALEMMPGAIPAAMPSRSRAPW